MKSNNKTNNITVASTDALLKLAKNAPTFARTRGRKSKLDQYADIIKELRSKNYTAQGVLDWLKANNGPQVKSILTVYHWEKRQKALAEATA